MAVYIGPAAWPVRGKHFCHMMSDKDSEELHAFAECLGLERSGCQREGRRLEYYVLSPCRRAEAVRQGAVEIGAQEMIKRCKSQ